jgi:hypothetical protein
LFRKFTRLPAVNLFNTVSVLIKFCIFCPVLLLIGSSMYCRLQFLGFTVTLSKEKAAPDFCRIENLHLIDSFYRKTGVVGSSFLQVCESVPYRIHGKRFLISRLRMLRGVRWSLMVFKSFLVFLKLD